MDKQKLNGFIDKYALGGSVESVKWKVSDKDMQTNFVSDDKTLLGNVKYNGIGFREGEYCVYTTSQFKKLLNVLDTDINVAVNHKNGRNYSVGMRDKSTQLEYVLSEESIIPKAPKLKQIPDFTVSIEIDGDFILRFLKAKAALSDQTNFTVMYDDLSEFTSIMIGYSESMVTNKISFEVKSKSDQQDELDPISFSADHLKEILLANRDMTSGTLEVSPAGLAKVEIKGPDFKSKYYLVQTQNN
jgi:hypothetical protein